MHTSQRRDLSEHLLRNRSFGPLPVAVTTEFIIQSRHIKPPSVDERLQRALATLVEHYPTPGSRVTLFESDGGHPDLTWKLLGDIFGGARPKELIVYLKELEELGYLEFEKGADGRSFYQKSFGTTLKAYMATSKSHTESERAFVAMWFDKSMTEVWRLAIDPAIREAGYTPIRVDEQHFNDKIDDRILSEIRQARFIVADFTCNPGNPRGGVYFEAGFALGLDRPVIYTCRDDAMDEIHFDTQMYNHIVWSDLEKFREDLKARILATIGKGPA